MWLSQCLTLLQGIYEGLGVIPAQFTVNEIREKVLYHVAPKMMEAAPGFPWQWDKLLLREVSNWYDLSQWYPAEKPYFYERFLDFKGKSKTPSFKRPKTAILLSLIIDAEQHVDVEQFLEDLVVSNVLKHY
jgi:hypothetical protein